MTINNRKAPVPAIGGFRASPQSYYSTGPPGAVASGIPGSASMTFFCLVVPRRGTTTVVLFARRNLAVPGGWGFIMTGTPGVISVTAANSTPTNAVVTSPALTTLEDWGVPYLLMANFQGGTLTFWMNGVLIGTNVTGVGGFTAQNTPTTIGVNCTAANSHAIGNLISDCGMLDGYDVSTFVSTMFGNGGPGLSAMWLEDLRQGRYLTWPRAAVANSDWYWAGRDAVVGSAGIVSWVDRYSAVTMAKTGQPQSASFPARPI